MSDNRPEPTITSETVFSGNLITVRKDTVRLSGDKTTTREIVVHPEVIAVLPVLDDGRIVFVRQFRKAADRIMLELPAGGIDDGETAEEAVRREMVEETGYRVGVTRLVSSFFTSPGFTTELMHFFVATGLEPGRPTEETDEIELVTLSLEDALRRMNSGEMADAKTILGLLWYQANGIR
ncbi:MAG TPA: NUDIX hydrolase [Chloroflexota bacterium]